MRWASALTVDPFLISVRVTDTDKANEKLVMELLKSHFPEHHFIGEVGELGWDGWSVGWLID